MAPRTEVTCSLWECRGSGLEKTIAKAQPILTRRKEFWPRDLVTFGKAGKYRHLLAVCLTKGQVYV